MIVARRMVWQIQPICTVFAVVSSPPISFVVLRKKILTYEVDIGR